MLASNHNHIENYFLIEELELLERQEFISKEQLAQLKKSTVTAKTNSNILLRFAFFLLGNFVISSVLGVFAFILTTLSGQEAFAFWFLVGAIGCVVAAEFIYIGNYFAYGFDDSFILSITLFFTIAVGIFTEDVTATLAALVISNVLCTIRYVHVPSVFFGLIGLIGLVGYAVIEERILPSYYLPIVLFIIAVALYFLQSIMSKSNKNLIYTNVFLIIKIMSLAFGYAALNYFVVRELSESLLSMELVPNQDIPLSEVFYIATFALPLFYIFIGLKKRDRVFLWMGLVTLSLAFASIRYYYYFLPVEVALMVGGSILFAMVYFSIRKFKDSVVGITFKEDKSLNPMAFAAVQALLVNANVNTQTVSSEQAPMEFGGGEFSGSGSGGSY